MKKTLPHLLILITLFLIPACQKDLPALTELAGTWELRTDVNGQSGKPTYYAAGNGRIIKFTPTTYEFYEHGKVTRSGSYTIKRDTFHIQNQLGNRIIYDNASEDGVHIFFSIENNKLNLAPDVYDGGAVIYERIQSPVH